MEGKTLIKMFVSLPEKRLCGCIVEILTSNIGLDSGNLDLMIFFSP
jgi:hypothetical protein